MALTLPLDRRLQEPEILDAHVTPDVNRFMRVEAGKLQFYTTTDPSRFEPGDELLRAEVLIERYLAVMAATGVHGMILQGPSMISATDRDPENVDTATASLEAVIAKRYPDKFAFWMRVDYKSKDLVGAVREARRRPGCVAIRLIVMSITDPERQGEKMFLAGGFEPLFKAAAEQGIPLNLFAPYHLADVPRIVERYPDLVLTLDHLGLPVRPYMPEPDAFGHLPQLLALAKYPRVAVKLSGAVALSEEPFPFRDLHAPLRKIVDAFGAERCIWASDFNRCLSLHTLGEAVTFMRYGDWLSDAERRMILGGSLRRRYGWPRKN